MARSTKMSYHPALDGLRGIAVMLVVLSDSLVPGFQGGFIGVDSFFVLSGFLITGILLRDIDSAGRIDLIRFYGHRVFRILPPLVAALIGSVAFAWWHGLSGINVLQEVGHRCCF